MKSVLLHEFISCYVIQKSCNTGKQCQLCIDVCYFKTSALSVLKRQHVHVHGVCKQGGTLLSPLVAQPWGGIWVKLTISITNNLLAENLVFIMVYIWRLCVYVMVRYTEKYYCNAIHFFFFLKKAMFILINPQMHRD